MKLGTLGPRGKDVCKSGKQQQCLVEDLTWNDSSKWNQQKALDQPGQTGNKEQRA